MSRERYTISTLPQARSSTDARAAEDVTEEPCPWCSADARISMNREYKPERRCLKQRMRTTPAREAVCVVMMYESY